VTSMSYSARAVIDYRICFDPHFLITNVQSSPFISSLKVSSSIERHAKCYADDPQSCFSPSFRKIRPRIYRPWTNSSLRRMHALRLLTNGSRHQYAYIQSAAVLILSTVFRAYPWQPSVHPRGRMSMTHTGKGQVRLAHMRAPLKVFSSLSSRTSLLSFLETTGVQLLKKLAAKLWSTLPKPYASSTYTSS